MAVDWNIVGIAAGTAFCGMLAVLFFGRPLLRAASEIRSLPRMAQGVLAALALVATLNAQKLRSGGGGLPDPPAAVTQADVARGYRLVAETNETGHSFAMPSNAVYVGRLHEHGARSDFGMHVVDFGAWAFPCGTNGGLRSRLWWFMDGRLQDAPRNPGFAASASLGDTLAVQGESRLWLLEDGGGRTVTWERFFACGDTNRAVNAQISLCGDGGFTVRSNDLVRVYRRVNPDDWDDDGIPNDYDIQPFVYDGDNFGPHQSLPEGANTNHYYWIDVVVSQANARVAFDGDGYSHLPDPDFIARAGDTNRVMLLLGKPYEIHCNMPIQVVGKEDVEVEVSEDADGNLGVVWPVSLEFVPLAPMRSAGLRSHGASGGTTIAVHPERASGGGFGWTGGFCCYYLTADGTPVFDCDGNCGCRGCFTGDITYVIGGFMMTFDGLQCPCEDGSGDDPAGEGDGYGEDDGPYAGGASATFSKSAVIFEDRYENSPGVWVERQSTQTELNCVAHGGPNGGHVRFEFSAGAGKLEHVSGRVLPVEQDVEAGKKLDFTVGYKGQLPSGEANDIVVTTTFTENVPNAEPVSSRAKVTSVKVELEAVYVAPENTNQHRHVYGVGEKVNCCHEPSDMVVTWSLTSHEYDNLIVDASACDNEITFSHLAQCAPGIRVSCLDTDHYIQYTLIEPTDVIAYSAIWDGECLPRGRAGGFGMIMHIYVYPMYVSFQGIDMVEVPCSVVVPPIGYYNTTNFTGYLSHTMEAGAGYWHHVKPGNYWSEDHVFSGERYGPWSGGMLVWNIPIAWNYRYDNPSVSWPNGHYSSTCRKIGGGDATFQQVFFIDAEGSITIEKLDHVVERGTNDVIFVDDVLVHGGGHL